VPSKSALLLLQPRKLPQLPRRKLVHERRPKRRLRKKLSSVPPPLLLKLKQSRSASLKRTQLQLLLQLSKRPSANAPLSPKKRKPS
jgi:hypothetical protein